MDLRRGLSRDGTGQGHSPTRRNCSTFRLNQQLNALWRHELWVGMGMESIRTPDSRPDGPGIDPCLPESQLGPPFLPTPDSGLDGGCVQGSAPGKAQAEAAGEGWMGGSSWGWGHCQL